MLNHDLTPAISKHALDRCHEMGISTKVAKAIYRTPATVWPCKRRDNQHANEQRYHVISNHWPTLGVVVAVKDDDPATVRVVTVLYWHGDGTGRQRTEHHDRQEHTP